MHSLVGTFGKVRGQGDFLQSGHQGPLVQEFRHWVESGLARAVSRAQFAEAFASNAPYAFVFRSRSIPNRALVGILSPSQDAVGRRFPLVAYAEVDPEPLYAFPTFVGLDAATLDPVGEHLGASDVTEFVEQCRAKVKK